MSINRSILRIAGPVAGKFLQGLTTVDMTSSRPDRLLYTAFLNPKGRVMADSIIHCEGDDRFLLELDTTIIGSFSSYLIRHRLRLPLSIDRAEGLSVRIGEGLADPRSGHLPPRSVSDRPAPSPVSDPEYHQIRISQGVPEGPGEIFPDSALPIAFNFDLLNGVSFTKGCYTGQELTTRTVRRGVVRRRVFPVRADRPVGKGDRVVDRSDRLIGEVFASSGEFGLALLQIGSDEFPLNSRDQIPQCVQSVGDGIRIGDSPGRIILPDYMKSPS